MLDQVGNQNVGFLAHPDSINAVVEMCDDLRTISLFPNQLLELIKLHYEITCFLHMQEQRHRSASR